MKRVVIIAEGHQKGENYRELADMLRESLEGAVDDRGLKETDVVIVVDTAKEAVERVGEFNTVVFLSAVHYAAAEKIAKEWLATKRVVVLTGKIPGEIVVYLDKKHLLPEIVIDAVLHW